jgi:hypothetical protein
MLQLDGWIGSDCLGRDHCIRDEPSRSIPVTSVTATPSIRNAIDSGSVKCAQFGQATETEGEMTIGIVLHNNESTLPNDLFVSVNDLNQAGGPAILVNQRINVDQTFALNVQDDQNGNGNITWTAAAVDGSKSLNATVSVTDGQTVDVTSW